MTPEAGAANFARLAGKELLSKLKTNGEKKVHEKDFGETVTNFDREINQFIVDEIKSHFPEHDIVTEEAELVDNGSETSRWFIDPIDGTNNFIRNIPLFCVSVGYEHDGELQAGAIYDPLNKMLFAGSLQEAKLNSEVLEVSKTKKIANAMIFEGHGYAPQERDRHTEIVSAINQEVKSRRELGTAALMLAYVARGQADGVVITGVKAWDAAAGVVLIRAAGGKVTNYKGTDWTPSNSTIVASNNRIHSQLLTLVK